MQIIYVSFAVYWLIQILDQTKSHRIRNRNKTIRDYVYSSNLLFVFPKWLIIILFFNYKLIKLPIPIVVFQITNYGFLFYSLYQRYVNHHIDFKYYMNISGVWVIMFFIFALIKIIDFEFYMKTHKSAEFGN